LKTSYKSRSIFPPLIAYFKPDFEAFLPPISRAAGALALCLILTWACLIFEKKHVVNADTVTVFGSVNPHAALTINGTAVGVNPLTGQYGAVYSPPANTWQTYTVTGSIAGAGMNGSAADQERVRAAHKRGPWI